MKKSIFRLTDLGFIIPIIVCFVLTIILFITLKPLQEVHGLTSLVSLVFLGIYIRNLFIRKSELDYFKKIRSKYFELMIDFGDYTGTEEKEIVEVAEKTVNDWVEHFGTDKGLEKVKTVWVWFKEMPMSPPGSTMTVAGYTNYYTTEMFVGFKKKNQELSRTAFSHELGHIIQANISGVWDQAEHHERSSEAGLP